MNDYQRHHNMSVDSCIALSMYEKRPTERAAGLLKTGYLRKRKSERPSVRRASMPSPVQATSIRPFSNRTTEDPNSNRQPSRQASRAACCTRSSPRSS